MQNISSHRTSYMLYGLLVVVVGSLFYIWNITNPATVSPVGILVVFVLLYLFWLSLFFVILHTCFILLQKTAWLKYLPKQRQAKPVKERLAYYVASILAFMPVLILAMQSVNQLTLRDIMLVLLFISLAVFYVVKRI
jgi:hypothetical protein